MKNSFGCDHILNKIMCKAYENVDIHLFLIIKPLLLKWLSVAFLLGNLLKEKLDKILLGLLKYVLQICKDSRLIDILNNSDKNHLVKSF